MVVWFALTISLQAAEQSLTWEECLRLAAQNNPSLAAAYASVDAANSAVAIEHSATLPQISASAAATQSGPGEETTAYSGSFNIEQSLYDGGRLQAAIRSASAELESEIASLTGSRSDVTYALRSAFIDVLHAKERVALLEKIEARREDNLELVELRYEGGREHKGSVASSQASLFDAQVQGKQAERSVSVARQILARQMGLAALPADFVVEGTLTQVSAPGQADFDGIAHDVPAYREAQASLERAEAQLSEARSGYWPDISLVGSLGESGTDGSFDGGSWSAGVELSIPLWSGGQTRHEVCKAEASVRAADADLSTILNERVRVLAAAQQTFADAIETVEVQEKYADAAEIRAQISRQQYEGGLLSFENWIVIEDDLIEKQEQLLDARKSALMAEAAWGLATGYEAFSQMNPSLGDEK
jgi:outer membrane protein TolC